MFLRCSKRKKDGKIHLSWSVVENRRLSGNRVVRRHVLYLGELNGRQSASWRTTIELIDPEATVSHQVELIPEEVGPVEAEGAGPATPVRLDQMRLERPRQWGACWLACQIWERLGLDAFWSGRLAVGREGTPWPRVLQTLVFYRWPDPGSEWRLHRHWYDHTARAVHEKLAAVQMLDVHLPTTDGREIVLSRYTQPEKDLQLLLAQLNMSLPAQPPPRIQSPQPPAKSPPL